MSHAKLTWSSEAHSHYQDVVPEVNLVLLHLSSTKRFHGVLPREIVSTLPFEAVRLYRMKTVLTRQPFPMPLVVCVPR